MKARAQIIVPGRISEAEALWYDTRRWPTFIEGFHHVVKASMGWPGEGELSWESSPDGRGRVLEKVTRFEPRVGQTAEVFEERSTGTQSISFVARPEDRVEITLEFDYRLTKRPGGPLYSIVDAIFIRPRQREALQRTLVRFARELAVEQSLEG
ncbi:MAG: hypothetical protein ACJ762_11915 [Solirubrobacteraceae bacterium]